MRGVQFFFLLAIFPYLGFSQNNKGGIPSGNFWGISGEIGVTSFYGDIDEGPAPGGILKNNKAFRVLGFRNFNSLVEISGRITAGGMSGQKTTEGETYTTSIYFNNSFIEYSFDAGVNLLALFSKSYAGRAGLYASVGVGLIDIKASLFEANGNLIKSFGTNGEKATTEFVLPLGFKGTYHFSPRSAVVIQTTISRVDTDKLDAKTGNNNRDYYNYFSIGYIFKFHDRRPGNGIHSY